MIALLVCGTLAACAATVSDLSDPQSVLVETRKPFNQTSSYQNITTIPQPTIQSQDDKIITLEKIMSDPDWIGQQPQNGYWSSDSATVYYQRKRVGSEIMDWYAHPLDGKPSAQVDMAQHHDIGSASAVYSADGVFSAYVFAGDIYLKNIKTQTVQQVTSTAGLEYAPQFLRDGQLAFRLGLNYFSWDMRTKVTRQLVNLVMQDEPQGIQAPSSYKAQQQHKLIDYVALQHKNALAAEHYQQQQQQANTNIYQRNFYLGAQYQLMDASLSPNGRWLIVALQNDDSWRAETDIMPNYITQDGGIAAQPARRRVADAVAKSQQLVLLDLVKHATYPLSFETLPGYDEDVLARVKTENLARIGKTYQTKRQPRSIKVIGDDQMKFNQAGDQLAVMLESNDHKDRWIAKVDLEQKKLKSVHRYHDEAWVNYTFNDFGWFNQSNQIYFLSEQSGFSHLYVLDEADQFRQLTKGAWEVSQPTLTQDDQYLYFTANQKHPGIYETYRVNVGSGEITQLTDLNGQNQYALSPDGKKLLVLHSEIALPSELYVKDLTADDQATRLTFTVSEEYLSYNWITPAIVPIPSRESVDPIFSKVYFPKDYTQGAPRRAVMFVHGAGYTQNAHLGWSYYFREFMFNSMLAQQGYVVIDMDYRASKGYGRDWRTWIYRNMGRPELEDFKDGVQWLVSHANVDPQRIGIYGGSYGGFMTLMSLFKAPDLFQVGAALRLVSDWAHYNVGYTANILNLPQDDSIAYERSSPIYFAEGLQAKLLINAPMLDDNVFFQDSVRLVQRLIELEKTDFETAIYPVEPHGFRQPSSWLDEYRRIYKLFEENL